MTFRSLSPVGRPTCHIPLLPPLLPPQPPLLLHLPPLTPPLPLLMPRLPPPVWSLAMSHILTSISTALTVTGRAASLNTLCGCRIQAQLAAPRAEPTAPPPSRYRATPSSGSAPRVTAVLDLTASRSCTRTAAAVDLTSSRSHTRVAAALEFTASRSRTHAAAAVILDLTASWSRHRRRHFLCSCHCRYSRLHFFSTDLFTVLRALLLCRHCAQLRHRAWPRSTHRRGSHR